MASNNAPARIRLIVTGRVQGVFFRASASESARAMGLRGLARNRADGAVEIVAEGPRVALERLAAWARQGPPLARVDEISVEWSDFTGKCAGFEIR
jgi:acylphosphatase